MYIEHQSDIAKLLVNVQSAAKVHELSILFPIWTLEFCDIWSIWQGLHREIIYIVGCWNLNEIHTIYQLSQNYIVYIESKIESANICSWLYIHMKVYCFSTSIIEWEVAIFLTFILTCFLGWHSFFDIHFNLFYAGKKPQQRKESSAHKILSMLVQAWRQVSRHFSVRLSLYCIIIWCGYLEQTCVY